MAVRMPEMREMRAKEIIALKTSAGMTNTEIAEQMGIHPKTVNRTLTWARKAGLFVKYEDQVLQDVVPAAIEALKTALADGDGELAVKVLTNTIWASQNAAKKVPNGASAPNEAGGIEDLAAYIAKIRQDASEEEETVDGTVVTGTESGVGQYVEADDTPRAQKLLAHATDGTDE